MRKSTLYSNSNDSYLLFHLEILHNTDKFKFKILLYLVIISQDTAIWVTEIQLHVFHLAPLPHLGFISLWRLIWILAQYHSSESSWPLMCSYVVGVRSPQSTCHLLVYSRAKLCIILHDFILFSGCDIVLDEVTWEADWDGDLHARGLMGSSLRNIILPHLETASPGFWSLFFSQRNLQEV